MACVSIVERTTKNEDRRKKNNKIKINKRNSRCKFRKKNVLFGIIFASAINAKSDIQCVRYFRVTRRKIQQKRKFPSFFFSILLTFATNHLGRCASTPFIHFYNKKHEYNFYNKILNILYHSIDIFAHLSTD